MEIVATAQHATHVFTTLKFTKGPVYVRTKCSMLGGHMMLIPVTTIMQHLRTKTTLRFPGRYTVKAKKIKWLEGIPASLSPEKPKKKPAKNSLEAVFGPDTHLYESLQQYREDEWRKTVLAFEANPSVYNSYWYIAKHPMFYKFTEAWKDGRAPRVHERHLISDQGWDSYNVRIDPHLVNPADDRISDDPSLNTKTEFWYEFGPTLFREMAGSGIGGHDHHCDGGADTYDKAIVKIAKKIHKVYGNDRLQVVKQWDDVELPQETDK